MKELYIFVLIWFCLTAVTNSQITPSPLGESSSPVTKISGNTDLAWGAEGKWKSPASGGRPEYKYQWAKSDLDGKPIRYKDDDAFYETAWFKVSADKRGPIKVKVFSKLVDKAGRQASDSFVVTIHEEFEVEVKGANPVLQSNFQEIESNVVIHTWTLPFTVEKSSSNSWKVGVSPNLELGLKEAIKFSVGLDVERGWVFSKKESYTVGLPEGKVPKDDTAGVEIQIFTVPVVTRKYGTWKKWGVGLVDSGDWEGTEENSVSWDSRIIRGEFVPKP